jgi:hypothetical protein
LAGGEVDADAETFASFFARMFLGSAASADLSNDARPHALLS